jgi:hypothetical protein
MRSYYLGCGERREWLRFCISSQASLQLIQPAAVHAHFGTLHEGGIVGS